MELVMNPNQDFENYQKAKKQAFFGTNLMFFTKK